MEHDREKLEKKHLSGSGWFNTIAVLSLINTIIVFAKLNIMFPVGLGTSVLAAAIFSYKPEEPGINLAILRIVGFAFFLMSLVIIALFFLFRAKAKIGKKWAYIVGLIVYFLDSLICLALKDWVSTGFHVWGLVSIWNGYSALRTINSIQISEKNNAMDNSLVQISTESKEGPI